MKILVARHGETTYNKARMVAGQIDVPLNEEGIAQAREAAATIPPECTEIISSDLLRCRQTTELLNAERALPVTFDVRLRERDFGSLAGKGYDDPAFQGGFWDIDKSQQYDYRPYSGESVEDVAARVFSLLREVRQKGGLPLLVTSAGVIKLLQHRLHGKAQEARISHSSIYEFEVPEELE